MTARLVWNEDWLVIKSETVRREAVGCIAWLGLEAVQKHIGDSTIHDDREREAHKECNEI
jgi:hypothetical protein